MIIRFSIPCPHGPEFIKWLDDTYPGWESTSYEDHTYSMDEIIRRFRMEKYKDYTDSVWGLAISIHDLTEAGKIEMALRW